MQITNTSTVDFVDKLGTDLTVVNAARVSFDKESSYDTVTEGHTCDEHGGDHCPIIGSHKLRSADDKLLKYLADHDHWSPFAHAQIQLRVTAPIFIARQLVKHQIGLVWNEVSRRYVTDEPTFFLPTVWRGKPVYGAKQGSHGEIELSPTMLQRIHNFLADSDGLYNDLMDVGVAAEQARMLLPVNLMTSWYWTGSLYACARVCKLRLDGHAQGEATDVAKQIDSICSQHFPHAWAKLVG